ncbi:pol polyprotein [Lasius niger]|uniref:RNA-directed DNA polymerase n=1 Tax=Lasius niger TaxID=67767 RepID=A0A0J7K6A5_LASNI|nr:pol polyprotein [Lasius niger]
MRNVTPGILTSCACVPLSFFSQKLTDTQKNYSTYDRELLAVYKALKYFRHLVEGRECTILTIITIDHKPLIYAFHQKSDRASPRQLRQLDYIAQFTTHLIHLPGTQNTVADALSRIQEIHMPTIISTEDIALEQLKDEELQELVTSPSTSNLQLRKLRLNDSEHTIFCDVSTEEIRLYIPRILRRNIFDTVHRLSHPGVRAMKELIARRFVWPGLNKDIAEWVKTCLACQRAKIQKHHRNLPEHIRIPDSRFHQVHIDIVGLLPPSHGYQYCLTAIDRFTRWPEAVPIKDINADTIVDAFYANWISRFGAPAIVTTDRGSQFESRLFQALIQLIGAHRTRTIAYHSSSNGMVKRFHRSLKSAVRCHATTEWVDVLPTVLLGLRASVKEDLKASAAELVYGTPIRLPGEFFIDEDPPEDPQIFIEKATCSHAFVRVDAVKRPFDCLCEGPYEIIERISDRVFKLKVKGEEVTISTERLKPAYQETIPPEDTAQDIPTAAQQSIRTYLPAKKQSSGSFKKPRSSFARSKRKGCRCGNGDTAIPGKLTCCGQRCPCYVESKPCVECRCRGCRNSHTADGLKTRPHIPELHNLQLQLSTSLDCDALSEDPLGSVPQCLLTSPSTIQDLNVYSTPRLDIDFETRGAAKLIRCLLVQTMS